ncbi:hypothetical protein F5Y06DRAFT_26445 [Hypoxylon sp. FL0890]|nr:hypothetical protein F5Y06DRAFT_26445 [Hypoxylon sp. FL0890]
MACEQNCSGGEGEQREKYIRQPWEAAGIEISLRHLAQETVLKASTSIEDPSPIVEVDAVEPSHLKVAPVYDQQSDCKSDQQTESYSFNWDGRKEGHSRADHLASASCISQADVSSGGQDGNSYQEYQTEELASWWQITTFMDPSNSRGNLTGGDDWGDGINTPYEEDWTDAIPPYQGGRYNAINTQNLHVERDDEGLRIAFINIDPEDSACLEAATWPGRPIER